MDRTTRTRRRHRSLNCLPAGNGAGAGLEGLSILRRQNPCPGKDGGKAVEQKSHRRWFSRRWLRSLEPLPRFPMLISSVFWFSGVDSAAVPELTRDAQLANGGYSVHLTLPAQQLETAKAAPDSLTRLGAAFGSGARALSDREILSRMARLAHERSDVPSVCLTHTIGPGKTVELASGQTLRARRPNFDLKTSRQAASRRGLLHSVRQTAVSVCVCSSEHWGAF